VMMMIATLLHPVPVILHAVQREDDLEEEE
jgi:hypothetical protein